MFLVNSPSRLEVTFSARQSICNVLAGCLNEVCANCSWCYIGETGRAFNTRRKEHLRNVKTAAKGSRIANHAWSHDHSIDFNNASVIDKGSFRTRKTLESWHSMVTPNADNNSCPLPGQYNILFTHIHN